MCLFGEGDFGKKQKEKKQHANTQFFCCSLLLLFIFDLEFEVRIRGRNLEFEVRRARPARGAPYVFEASLVFEVGWQARLKKRCGRSLPSGYTSHHPNTSPVHSLALALMLAASGGRAQAVQRKAVGCKAVGCKAMGCKPWGCNTGEVVVVRWCGEVVERWEHVHVHTHTPHTHRRMS